MAARNDPRPRCTTPFIIAISISIPMPGSYFCLRIDGRGEVNPFHPAASTGVVRWVCCPIGRDGHVANCASS